MPMLVFWVVTPCGHAGLLKMGAVFFSEAFVSAYKFTRRYNLETQHRRDDELFTEQAELI
jgi:hypothetical protein